MEMESLFDSSEEEEVSLSALRIPISIRHPGWTNLLLVLSYVMFGVAFLTTQQNWQPVTALYVVVQIVTTIGYGDITVTNEEKIFMTFYVLLGTVLVAKVVNDVSEDLLDSANSRIDHSLHRVEEFLSPNHEEGHGCCPAFLHRLIVASLIFVFFVMVWVLFFVLYEPCSCSYGFTRIEGCEDGLTCADTGGDVKSVVDAIYMAIITYSTVGFGDFTPDTRVGRIFSCVVMVLGVVSFFNVVSAVADVIAETQRFYRRQLRLSLSGFARIDRDGTGAINKTEFQVYMLLRQGQVTVSQLNRFDQLFECMDKDKTGKLSYEEIRAGMLDVDLM